LKHNGLVVNGDISTRRDRILTLLDHYNDYFTTLGAGTPTGGGDGIPGLPSMSQHASVVELVRCLDLLLVRAPKHYQHAKAFYCCEKRQVPARLKVVGPQGKRVTVDGWAVERIVPRWVRLERVRRAVEFVDREFRGEPFVPQELVEQAA